MGSVEISLTRQDTSKMQKEITQDEAIKLIDGISLKFNIDVMDLVKKVASKQADGFSLNKNSPYTHLYIGNGSDKITIELMTLENETKIKVPKSFFLV
jgi:hypothetical protein